GSIACAPARNSRCEVIMRRVSRSRRPPAWRRPGDLVEISAYRGHMTQNLADLPDAPRWRGVNHLALVTPDMDATVRFYAGVLGMRVVAATMAGPMRHYFFEIGPQNTVAFFEVKDAETFDKGAGSPPPVPIPIQMDHLSFNLPDEA